MTTTPRAGLRFRHCRFRERVPGRRVEDSPHEVCRVTRVTKTAVYYRTADGADNRYVVDPSRFADIVLEEIT